MRRETLNMLGLAKKAGAVMSGAFLLEQAVHKRKAKLVLLAADASENTRKQVINLCKQRPIPLAVAGDKAELGHALGQGERSCLAVTDDNLAAAIRKRLEEEGIKLEGQGV